MWNLLRYARIRSKCERKQCEVSHFHLGAPNGLRFSRAGPRRHSSAICDAATQRAASVATAELAAERLAQRHQTYEHKDSQ